MARDAEAIIAQSLAIRLQDEATKRGDTTEATRKEIEAAQKSAQAKRSEAEQSAASAQSKIIEAEATKASTLAYQDNSARVNELRSAAAAAATEVDRLVRLQREGKATDEEVSTARAKASAATLLYRDALHDASDAAERKIAVDRQSAQIAQASISVDLDRVKAQQEVAEANGDTAKSAQLAQQATMLQVRAAEQSAAASRAEAQAIRDAADVKERELRATGELTTAKLAELDAQRKSADMKDLEAQKADILAKKTRALAASESARTDVLEKQISAEEKKNALIERQIALEQKRLNVDKEGYSLDTSGKRVSADVITTRSVYEQAKSAGLDEKQSLAIANEFVVNGKAKTPDRANAAEGETSYTLIAKAIDKLVLANAAKAAIGPTSNSPSPAPPPATNVASPSPSPAPAEATTRNVNISVNSGPLGRMTLDQLSEEVFDRLLARLADDKRKTGR